ncbi:NACHT domain-containing protein [Streptomyces griseorubiginosus]|uniref:NACHT domain-containing protein n=1 Tax=Streptomyces griseorubiginosus TaxID=67304 RepID=UPI002E8081AF|nr:NACHT domain-containing protein [Streptomyces griseorubiginosus]WUB44112.1 NACHT domain-containing protein [Streptomyces griseorubiginosus]WUB52630.1 NACHT domain-containing protein [Streptomyces griseorubiginosus]
MSVEVAALRLGQTVATSAVRLWLGGRRSEQERLTGMSELVRLRIPGLRSQRSVERQFEEIADAVAARMEPLLAHEFQGLAENERLAAAHGVMDTFRHADLSDESVLASDADAAELARRIRRDAPRPVGLGEAGERYYDLLFAECCDCYVRILRRLPVFSERALTELLGRTTSLGVELARVLERLPTRSLYAPEGTDEDTAFLREYLELVSRSLDEVELFRLASEQVTRAKLSVAYVSMRATSDDGRRRRTAGGRPPLRRGLRAWEEAEGTGMRVEKALGGASRVLLRGEAGSGKTTLMQWLAVMAARSAFRGPLGEWNRLVPVLVKLRRYAGRGLPLPEALLDGVAGPLTGHMPKGWTDRMLRDGRVLLLVDGVDELLAVERSAVREWLRRLLHAYPDVRVVVTSRPAAARVDWLRTEGFTVYQLERMTPADLTAFVRQWHAAVREQGDELPCSVEELPHYERSLLTSLQDRPHLQSLATNPLLAALICALHLSKGRQLPRNRMELYKIALETLVQHRDADRRVPSAEAGPLTLPDKLCVLRDLAWRLSDNNRTEIPTDQARRFVASRMTSMRHLDGVDRTAVLDHLVARSGVLRSPVEGRVDFVHRTFQEYLAAQDAADEDNMGNLVERAHLDLWRETIVMAAGHANLRQRRELVAGILDRADTEPRHTRRLRLLAAACLETMSTVPDDLARRLDEALDALVPPRRSSEAGSLASVGPALVRRLPRTLERLSERAARTTVRTAALVGGEGALELLAGYAEGASEDVQKELVDAWEYFDPDEYAERVLPRLPLEELLLQVTHPAQWPAAQRLKEARRVWIGYEFTDGLAATSALGELDWLWVPQLRGDNDLSPLARRPTLRNLVVGGGEHLPLLDVGPLRGLTSLHNLQLQDWASVPPLETLPMPPGLVSLGLGRLDEDTDLGPLLERTDWTSLALQGSGTPRGLSGLSRLTRLTHLTLYHFDLSAWLPTLESAPPRLSVLNLFNCRLPRDLGPIGALDRLRRLQLRACRTADEHALGLPTLARDPYRTRLTVTIDPSVRPPTSPVPGVRVKRH